LAHRTKKEDKKSPQTKHKFYRSQRTHTRKGLQKKSFIDPGGMSGPLFQVARSQINLAGRLDQKEGGSAREETHRSRKGQEWE
jgi:hypothetical protein